MEIFIRGLIALGIALAVATLGFSDTVAPVAPAAPANGDGWSPLAKKLFGRLHGNGCSGSNAKARAPQQPEPPRHAPRTQPGTVVFPQHPFARSPRDFFMVD